MYLNIQGRSARNITWIIIEIGALPPRNFVPQHAHNLYSVMRMNRRILVHISLLNISSTVYYSVYRGEIKSGIEMVDCSTSSSLSLNEVTTRLVTKLWLTVWIVTLAFCITLSLYWTALPWVQLDFIYLFICLLLRAYVHT